MVLNQTCPGESASHVHKPWGLSHTGTFATAEETAYPLPLARAIACAFQDALKADGWKWPASEWSEIHSDPSFAAMRAVAGRQPKASKVPPLVPEFKSIVTVFGPLDLVQNPPCNLMSRLKSVWVCPQTFSNSISSIPLDSQLLRISSSWSKRGQDGGSEVRVAKLVWGIPWSFSEFVQKAVQRGHPRSFGSLLPEELYHAVSNNCQLSSAEVAATRARWFSKWVARAKDLEQSEAVFKSSLSPHLRHILQPKRLLLLKEIIQAEKYPDSEVFDELAFGTSLTGTVPATGVFDKSFKPALSTMDDLMEGAPASNAAIFHSVRSSGDDEVDGRF